MNRQIDPILQGLLRADRINRSSGPSKALEAITHSLRLQNDKLEAALPALEKIENRCAAISASGWPAVRR